MRQTMVLADKGWIDPSIWMNLLQRRSRRYLSHFLLWALAVVLLGAVSAPLQELFLSQKSRKMPYDIQWLQGLTEVPDLFGGVGYLWGDNNLMTILTRSAVTSTSLLSVQPRLWQRDPRLCNNITLFPNGNFPSTYCSVGGSTLNDMAALGDPFLAPLPSNFSTGLIRQFSPRVNSSAHISNITSSDWPQNCNNRPGSFFVQYGNATNTWSWSITLCMPANYSYPLIRNTRLRQDFSESVYINISLNGLSVVTYTQNLSMMYRLDLDTTIGYFELPNYMNNQAVGPILEVDARTLCGKDCAPQGYSNTSIAPPSSNHKRTTDNSSVSVDTALALEALYNKPPLLSIIMALFGEGSYLADRMAHPNDFHHFWSHHDNYYQTPNSERNSTYGACIGAFPFVQLTYATSGPPIGNVPCLKNSVEYESDLTLEMIRYVLAFVPNFSTDPSSTGVYADRLENAFNAAAFLANEVLFANNQMSGQLFQVWFDPGQDVQAPQISLQGIIVVSLVLGLFLCNLLAVAVYSCYYPRWTQSLDAFAMMRFGAAIHEHLPLNYVGNINELRILDEMPGYVGDAAEEGAEFGRLGIGAKGPLRRNKKYLSRLNEDDPSLAPSVVVT